MEKQTEKNAKISKNYEEVKSRAVVKYSAPKPATFTKLECNTNLNLPPTNWLSSSADSYGLQRILYNKKGFSSFRMAHMFPDCVGEVDVVSDAENIKNLLKIPYDKGHISMMVHRIENTLLLDDFDIYKHLLRNAETNWEWLRNFFYKNVNEETYQEDKNIHINKHRREALQQKSLVSKFLYHSLAPENEKKDSQADPSASNNSLPLQFPLLPEPAPSAQCPDSQESFDHGYNRNVVWTFEDIEMLIGTDMPIFGGGTHPCISLRLRDMTKPISVLTGIDYWLDNLMSNVPEVVMCYHLNGIVQKYELIKTEDLPRLDNSKFSPKLIRDVAQSILSFLKSNATKAGHTYWLFKGKDEEVVKLYDLTSLCSQSDVEESNQNPFTIPVGMLLYRVARNMKHSTENAQPGTIRELLKNCVKLLPEEKYPEIVTSSLYMLADLYVPASTNPENPNFEPENSRASENVVYDDDLPEDDTETKVLTLDKIEDCDKFTKYYKGAPPLVGSVEERCLQALSHIASGLSCLKYFKKKSTECEGENIKEEEVQMAKPFEPIPMPYAKLGEENSFATNQQDQEANNSSNKKSSKRKDRRKKSKNNERSDILPQEEAVSEIGTSAHQLNALLLKNNNEAQKLPTWYEQDVHKISWKDHLKTLLYEKAVLVYAILSEYHFIQGRYGSSLRNIGLLARCQQVMNKLQYASNALRENCLLGRAGDCCIMMVQNWKMFDAYREQLQNNHEEDFKMMEQLEKDEQTYNIRIGDSNIKCVFIYDIRTIEQILLKGAECYEQALKISEAESILSRLGNCLNEIGSFYLNKAKASTILDDIVDACKKGEPYLFRGLEVFEKVKDKPNIALLHSNIGHLYRLLAFAYMPEQRGELTQQEKLYFKKSFLSYKRALQVLGDRESCPGIWDAVKWELSTALFTMGTIMHENPPSGLSKAETEREVIDILQKALSYCDLDEENIKFPLYQYRAAIIHYRIASLYHSHIWNSPEDVVNRKNLLQLTKINYEKAAKLYFLSNDCFNYLNTQMQRIALNEYLAETTTSLNSKLKHFQLCLDIILETREMLQLVINKKVDFTEETQENNETNKDKKFNTCFSLLKLIKTRLQHILKCLVKICLTKPAPNKDCANLAEIYKDCYKVTLTNLGDNLDSTKLLKKLFQSLEKIQERIAS